MTTFWGYGYMFDKVMNLIKKKRIKKYASSPVTIMKYNYLVW